MNNDRNWGLILRVDEETEAESREACLRAHIRAINTCYNLLLEAYNAQIETTRVHNVRLFSGSAEALQGGDKG